MLSVRCRCGKIVCQLQNVPRLPPVQAVAAPAPEPSVIILCRHCKGYVVLRVPTISAVEHTATDRTPPVPITFRP